MENGVLSPSGARELECKILNSLRLGAGVAGLRQLAMYLYRNENKRLTQVWP